MTRIHVKNLTLALTTFVLLAGCHSGSSKAPTPDTTAPTISVSAAPQVSAADSAGVSASNAAIIAFLESASATDGKDGEVSVTNDAPSSFPLGDTTVTFSASDAAGNVSSVVAVVTVVDDVAPTITAPVDITVQATSSSVSVSNAEVVAFISAAVGSDAVDGAVTVVNDAPAKFFAGNTTVTFTASDAAGNESSDTAVVTIVPATISGTAVKGPLYKATVFYDYNGDGLLTQDPLEPSTTSNKDGGYSLTDNENVAGAIEDFVAVLVMNEDTIDYISGESYANTGVVLKGTPGGSVITPLTTLFVEAKDALEESVADEGLTDEELQVRIEAQFVVALDLPVGLDVANFNPYEKVEGTDTYLNDLEDAQAVEAVAESLMTTILVMSETVVGVSEAALGEGNAISREKATDVAIQAIAKITVESSNIVEGNGSDIVENIDGAIKFSDIEHLDEIEQEIISEIESADEGSLGAALTDEATDNNVVVNVETAVAVAEYTLDVASSTISVVSKALEEVEAEDFGSVAASSVSVAKKQAQAEAADTNKVVLDLVEAFEAGDFTEFNNDSVDLNGVVTLNDEESLATTVALNVVEVTAHVVETAPPVFTSENSFSVPENQRAVGTVGATSIEGEVLSFALTGSADDALFSLSENGVLTFNEAPDFEARATAYSITITVSDESNDVDQVVSINVTDQNEAAPTIISAGPFVMDEGTAVVGIVEAQATAPSVASLSYELSGVDSTLVSVDAATGALSLESPADFESNLSYSVLVTVTDPSANASTTVPVTIFVTNANDELPVFVSATAPNFVVSENHKAVGTVAATDLDGDSLSYSIVSGADASFFEINSALGVVRFVTAPDFEARSPAYSATVTVTDGVNTATRDFTVNVTDFPENDAFRLATTSMMLVDYNPASQLFNPIELDVVVSDDSLSVDLSSSPINLQNMQNALVEGADFNTPTFDFELMNLPDVSGSGTVSFVLLDGEDSVQDSGERIVTVSDLAVSYNSTNGRTAVFTLPAQTITVTYENTLGAVINLTIENDQADSFSITRDGIAYSDLNEKLLALIGKIDSLPLETLLNTGIYNLQITTSGIPLSAADGTLVNGLNTVLVIGEVD